MSLPKLDCLVYELDLPLSKKHVRFRPFLVKEQRNLLIAMESNDKDTIEKNINQVLHNCTLSELDIEKLPILDVEYYFINLRARSVGEIVENKYKCENPVDGKPCGNLMDIKFNLLDVNMEINPNIKDTIQLTPKLSMKLKYPEFSVLERSKQFTNKTDMAFDMILDCIEWIYDGEQYFYAKESTRQELEDFVNSLNQQQFSKVEEFFEYLPKLNKKLTVICGKCKFNHTIEVEGLENFFG
jgi:hypothetical protein